MLEVRILVSDVDYDSIVDLALPLVGDKLAEKGGLLARLAGRKEALGDVARRLIRKKGPDRMEDLVVDLAAKKRSTIIEKVSAAVAKKGVGLRIVGIDVKKI